MIYYRVMLRPPPDKAAYFAVAWKIWLEGYNQIGSELEKQTFLSCPSTEYEAYQAFGDVVEGVPRLGVRALAGAAFVNWRDMKFHVLVPPDTFKIHRDLMWVSKKNPTSVKYEVTVRLLDMEKIRLPMIPAGLGFPQWKFFKDFPLVGARWNADSLQLVFRLPERALSNYEMYDYRLNPDWVFATARSPKGSRQNNAELAL